MNALQYRAMVTRRFSQNLKVFFRRTRASYKDLPFAAYFYQNV